MLAFGYEFAREPALEEATQDGDAASRRRAEYVM
jgi:hypothetical protein